MDFESQRRGTAPTCCGVFEIVSETKIELRGDYNPENSVSDPRTTPEEQSVTEILVATI
jgi:hypothetical protein